MVSTIIALTKVVDVESDAVIIISQLFTTSFIFKLLADLLCWCCWWGVGVGWWFNFKVLTDKCHLSNKMKKIVWILAQARKLNKNWGQNNKNNLNEKRKYLSNTFSCCNLTLSKSRHWHMTFLKYIPLAD